MHITLAAIGKLKDTSLKALYNEYKKRLDWKITLQECETKNSPEQEAPLLLAAMPPAAFLIVLDERGDNLTSEDFAENLQNIQLYHHGKVGFMIGGADGLSEGIKKRAQKSICFGHMTWPHMLVRILLMEQLYRAQQILKGHPYHRA